MSLHSSDDAGYRYGCRDYPPKFTHKVDGHKFVHGFNGYGPLDTYKGSCTSTHSRTSKHSPALAVFEVDQHGFTRRIGRIF